MFKYTQGQKIIVKETGFQNVVHQSLDHNVMCVDGSIKHVDDIKPFSFDIAESEAARAKK